MMHLLVIALVVIGSLLFGFEARAQENALKTRMTGAALEWADDNGRLRQAMQAFPKGADLHTHLRGAVYAESWIEWAAEDGLCADMGNDFFGPSLKFKEKETCEASGWITAAAAQGSERNRRELINAMSTRSYVPTLNWSGHNDFFETFANIAVLPNRLGDQLAEVAERAGSQNILYLELMETIVFPELFPLVAGLEFTGDVEADFKTLMASPFGTKMPDFVASIRGQLDVAYIKKNELLGCADNAEAVGCDVEIQFIHQVIREFPPAMVFAQIALGWEAMKQVPQVVGLNLVAPEDGHIALRDYSLHMKMIDHLYRTQGERNVTLHAGELTLGLVRPHQLKFHIREAIELGHAKRIGHGIDIAFEDDSEALAKRMAAEGIMVEINLTSNDVILGVKGKDHPIIMYRDLEVPYALSTDDEGVSRIDLTHEYMRFMRDYSVPYQELKYASRNSLTYSFLPGGSLWDSEVCVADAKSGNSSEACTAYLAESRKAQLQWELEARFRDYENTLRIPQRKKTSFN
jgi:adenosine deaminase